MFRLSGIYLCLAFGAPAALRTSLRARFRQQDASSIRPVSAFNPWAGNRSTSVFDGKLLLLHVGKTGGTTINMALKHSINTARVEILDHLSSHAVLQDCEQHPSQRYALFVRSPLHRFTSAWISRFTEGKPNFYTPWSHYEAWTFRTYPTPDKLACAVLSPDRDWSSNATWAMQHIKHVLWDLNYYVGGLENLRKCKSQIAFVGRSEHYNEDFARLVKMLSSEQMLLEDPARVLSNAVRRHATAATFGVYKQLSRCAVEALKDWYSDDYKIINFLVEEGLIDGGYAAEIERLDAPPPWGWKKGMY